MKKLFVCLLLLTFIVTLCGCEKDVSIDDTKEEGSGAKPEDTSSIDISAPQMEISNDGYGRMEYTAGGLRFRVGDTVDEFVKAGFTAEEEDLNTVLEPWGFKEIWIKYDAGREYPATMVLTVLNESDSPQYVRYSRTVSASARYAIEGSNQIKTDVSYRADVEKSVPSKDLMLERYMLYGLSLELNSNNVIGVGNAFNCIKYRVDSSTDMINGVEIIYLDNLFDEIDYSAVGSLSSHTPIQAASLLSGYFDTIPYLTYYGGLDNHESLDKVLNDKTLTIKLDGKEFSLGQNEDTYSSLVEKGWSFTIEEERMLDEGDSSGFVNMAKIGDSEVKEIHLTNVTDNAISWKEAKITGITIDNKECVCTGNKNAPEFDFYGLNGNSTISDVISRLGLPENIDYSIRSVHLAELQYRFVVDEEYSIRVWITVDTINNSIYEIDLTGWI